jgi:hypothetical protein
MKAKVRARGMSSFLKKDHIITFSLSGGGSARVQRQIALSSRAQEIKRVGARRKLNIILLLAIIITYG